MKVQKIKGFDGQVVEVKAVIGDRKYGVCIYKDRDIFTDKVRAVEVNWSALGSQSPDVAEQYALLILEAVREARQQQVTMKLSKIAK